MTPLRNARALTAALEDEVLRLQEEVARLSSSSRGQLRGQLDAMTDQRDYHQSRALKYRRTVDRQRSELRSLNTLLEEARDEILDLQEQVQDMVSKDWNGLMEILNCVYPEDIFPTMPDTEGRDYGPRIVSLVRSLVSARAEGWAEGVETALNHAILNPDGITLRLEKRDGQPWPNPFQVVEACPTCSGPVRKTVGMICLTCGTDYGTETVS